MSALTPLRYRPQQSDSWFLAVSTPSGVFVRHYAAWYALCEAAGGRFANHLQNKWVCDRCTDVKETIKSITLFLVARSLPRLRHSANSHFVVTVLLRHTDSESECAIVESDKHQHKRQRSADPPAATNIVATQRLLVRCVR